jgi:hypothetical protein
MKRYKLGDFTYWFDEDKVPEGAIPVDTAKAEPKKVEASEDTTEVKAKVKIPLNKSKGVKAK